MKNIFLLPTDKPSMLQLQMNGNLHIENGQSIALRSYQNIYITNDEEIKLNDYVIQVNFEKTNIQMIQCVTEFQVKIANDKDGSFKKKKIILTTDQDSIKDGVQSIDDEFLEWFVKNPSCEFVEVIKDGVKVKDEGIQELMKDEYYQKFPEELPNCIFTNKYKIIIPKEESNPFELPNALPDDVFYESFEFKQETVEYELIQHIKFCLECNNESQAIRLLEKYGFEKQEKMYSEDEVWNIIRMVSGMKESGKSDIEISEYFGKNIKK